MFNHLSERLGQSLDKLRGISRLTEDNTRDSLADIRRALLDADVALSVVDDFVARIQTKALGQLTVKNVRPGEALVKLVQDELTHILGDEQAELNLKAQKPIVFVMAGLQGSGKTTTTAKLARYLIEQHNLSVMLTSADVYRPAAIDQLETLAKQVSADFFPSSPKDKPKAIVKAALAKAKTQFNDVLIIDTAGRLHIDSELMDELQTICSLANPTETLLVVDSMTGQDAANIAKQFNETLDLTGVILTKADGDARGGAALSMKMITGKPIKFMGVGEKIDALEAFHPDRLASRILGMGDIVSLVEDAERKIDKHKADKLAKKVKKGKRFDFNDFLDQLHQMKKMGGLQSMLGKLPGMGGGQQLPKAATEMLKGDMFVKMEAIIQSMTPNERQFPALLNGSRKRRISMGSGTQLQDINKLIKQFTQMQKMVKRFKGDKMSKRLKQLEGQLPPDLLDQIK